MNQETYIYHVVSSQGGVILGAFGSALLAEAQRCAARVERDTGCHAYVEQVRSPHLPGVGGKLSDYQPAGKVKAP